MIARAGETETKLWPWLEAYAADESTFDECLRPDGSLREAFAIFGGSIPGLDGTDLKRRADAARRIIQEQRITYTVDGDPSSARPPFRSRKLCLAAGQTTSPSPIGWERVGVRVSSCPSYTVGHDFAEFRHHGSEIGILLGGHAASTASLLNSDDDE